MPTKIHPEAAQKAQRFYTCSVNFGIAAACGDQTELLAHGAELIKAMRAVLAQRDTTFYDVIKASYDAPA